MELGHYQLEVLISAGVLVCMVIAALMCDLLKGKNEQLRELVTELKIRNEEASRREQLLLARPAADFSHTHRVTTAQALTPPAAQTEEQVVPVEQSKPVRKPGPVEQAKASKNTNRKAHRRNGSTLSPDAVAAIQRGVEMAVNPKTMAAKMRPAAPVSAPIVPEFNIPAAHISTAPVSTAMNTPNAKGLAKIAMPPAKKPSFSPAHVSAAAQVSSTESTSLSPSLQAAKLSEGRFVERQVRVEEVETVVVGSQTMSAPGATSPKLTVQTAPAVKKNWGALLNKTEKKTTADSGLLDAIVAATTEAKTDTGSVPAGYHDGFVLTQLIKSHQPLSGLVVSISVAGEITAAVSDLMRSLLGPTDFGCQSAADEFLLIYPNERGAAAQRKLSSIAQQLWSFQLGNLGECSIVFSWGGVEARSEAVEMAIASANDRMQETKRGRKLAAEIVPAVQAA